MKGDFSRDSFDPARRFSRVLMQQGRVQVDADWNEQVAIQLNYLRTLAADLIGPHGGPAGGFLIRAVNPDGTPIKNDLLISRGHYYVDGWLCENDSDIRYRSSQAQPYRGASPDLENGRRYLTYLDAWERHVASLEVDGRLELESYRPGLLRDPGLGGADTASRAQVIWQVKVSGGIRLPDREIPLPDPPPANWRQWVNDQWSGWIESWQGPARGRLQAEAAPTNGGGEAEACTVAPDARYRGFENQLYRVEIHRGGAAAAPGAEGATFKWSRENGSVAIPVEEIAGTTLRLASWWRDDRMGLAERQWVEVVNDASALENRADPLRRIVKVDRDEMTVTLGEAAALADDSAALHPVIRRWDHRARRPSTAGAPASNLASDNALSVMEEAWIPLEHGVRIRFRKPDAGQHRYRTGDYWLIPARTALGDVLWPKTSAGGGSETLAPDPLPPHGVEHHYAPLGIIELAPDGVVSLLEDLRLTFGPLAKP